MTIRTAPYELFPGLKVRHSSAHARNIATRLCTLHSHNLAGISRATRMPSLQLKKTRGRAVSKVVGTVSKPRGPSGIYDHSIPLPSGFRNRWNSCYATSALHCFFNVMPLKHLCTCVFGVHPEGCSCKQQGRYSQFFICNSN